VASTETIPAGTLGQLRIATAIQLAGFTFLTYDYLLTFSEEVDLIWRRKLNSVSPLYLSTRCLVFIDSAVYLLATFDANPSIPKCRLYVKLIVWSWFIGVFIAQSILLLRTFVICHWDRCVVILLLLIHFGCSASYGWIQWGSLEALACKERACKEVEQ